MLRRAAIGSLALIGALALVAVGTTFHGAASPGVAGDRVRQAQPIIGDAPDSIGKILWVDDHPENNVYEKQFFEKHRIAVHPVTTSEDALKLLAIYDYKAVISDMGRGEDRLAGARFVQQLRARNDRTPVIIYTVRADSPAKQRAQRELVAESGAQALAVTPEQVRAVVLDVFGNPPERAAD
jgi:CheY-like chemotaxis protein